MVEHLSFLASTIPFVFWSAIAFYILASIVLAHPWLRAQAAEIFRSPVPSTHSHLLALDGLRGAATLAVLCLHVWQWLSPFNDGIFSFFLLMSPGLRDNPSAKMGGKSVAVFIVLSGFLVYRSLRDRCGSIEEIRTYLKRRFFRIYPLYFFSVIALALFGYINPEPTPSQGFLSELLMLRTLNHKSFGNPTTWSLYVEVLFYVLMPIWVIATRRNPLKAAVIAFFLLSLTGVESIAPTNRELSLIKFFFAGIAVCELTYTEWFRKLSARGGALLFGAGLGILFLDLCRIDPVMIAVSRAFEVFGVPFISRVDDFTPNLGIGFAVLTIGALKCRPIARLLSFYPLRFIGVISYSLYLWHSFIIIINTPVEFNRLGHLSGHMTLHSDNGLGTFFLIYLPAVVLYSAISYALIEQPFRVLGTEGVFRVGAGRVGTGKIIPSATT